MRSVVRRRARSAKVCTATQPAIATSCENREPSYDGGLLSDNVMRRSAIPIFVLIALAAACGSPQRPDTAGYTPLMRAARDGDIEAIRRLIEGGHDVNYQGRQVVRYSILFP